jgi:glucan phosphoethanolaminetransferase (alkaline phosphatase superfamily)
MLRFPDFNAVIAIFNDQVSMIFTSIQKKVFILGSYLLLTLLPLVEMFSHGLFVVAVKMFAISCFSWMLIWAVFERPARFHWLLLPVFLLMPVDIVLRVAYGQSFSAHYLGVFFESGSAEAIDFLAGKFTLTVLSLLFFLCWWLLVFIATQSKSILAWTSRSRNITATMLVMLFLLIAFYPRLSHIMTRMEASGSVQAQSNGLPKDYISIGGEYPPHLVQSVFAWMKYQNDAGIFESTRPLGHFFVAYEFIRERVYLDQFSDKNKNFTFDTSLSKKTAMPQTVVLVIGESSRFDRWGINGYSRKTSPLLDDRSHLVSLSNMITGVTATRLSVPVILSRKPVMPIEVEGFSEKSLISAYKLAGFKTFWISNQLSLGSYDTAVSIFAREADVLHYVQKISSGSKISYDENLLPVLGDALHDTAERKLIVLHTMGSHWEYAKRYPEKFSKWLPVLPSSSTVDFSDRANKVMMNNSYDASILYTDYILDSVIRRINVKDRSAVMFYLSDHGETLFDDMCPASMHGHNTDYEFHIPAFFWYSDQFHQMYPEKVGAIEANRNAPLSTENVFYSMLDIADIKVQEDQNERSFVSSSLIAHPRYVNSEGWINYDKSYAAGSCKEITSVSSLTKK